MHETELHDLSDDADYAASQLEGSMSMMRCDADERSSSGYPDGAEVVYSKDNVAIHPMQFASERISGRLKLIKQGSSLLMTWIPYKAQRTTARLSEKDRNLYTIGALPFTDVRSIHRHTPALGWQYIIVVLTSGLAFPTLYFYNGGVREFLATVKQHVFLVRSAEDANVFLVNDFQNPLQRTLSSLQLPMAISVASVPSTPITVGDTSLTEGGERTSEGFGDAAARRRHRSHDPSRDLSIQVLEKFSLVTKFARETTSQLFRENNGFGTNERRWDRQFSHDNLHKKSSETEILDDAENFSHDVDKASHESSVAPDPLEAQFSQLQSFRLKDLSCIPEPSDADHSIPFKRKFSFRNSHVEEALTSLGTFELSNNKEFDKLSLVWGKPRQQPLGAEEWATFLDSEGRVVDSNGLRKRVFYGGVAHQLRREVWPLLLGYHAYESTYAEREYLKSVKKSEYETIKWQWKSISPQQAKRFTKFRERKGLIEKDVVRTDRSLDFYDGDDNPNVNLLRDILLTYSFYNFDLGYCQGMSDLLSPILYIVRDESESFWCFVALMERLGPNFNRDQNGMHSQLFALSKLVEILDSPLHNYFKQNECLNYFFCFRWVLIQFKREFEYEKVMRLWEVLWSHYLSEHLHLYVCVAVLKRYRAKIMGDQMDFDTLLKFINELSGHIDLDATLRDAEALCICGGESCAASIPPGTPPSLPVDDNGYVSPEQDEAL